MKKISLAKRIETYLQKHGGWVHKGVLEELAKKATYIKKGKVCHYLAENCDRRCREMVQGKKSNGQPCPITLEKREVGNSVEYRYKTNTPLPPKPQITFLETENGRVALLTPTK